MKLIDEKIPVDVRLVTEPGEVADVYCRRCEKPIGRLQTIPAEADADQEEIYAEIQLIAEEHRPLCTSPGSSVQEP